MGAAVGLGSIWRFPYVAGANGGSTFVFVFVLSCIFIATPLLVAEFAIGRQSRTSPPEAAGRVARTYGFTRIWDLVGVTGTVTIFLIMSYYTIIAGWVMAYTWKSAAGSLAGLDANALATKLHAFLSDPVEVSLWHIGFLSILASVSALGVSGGLELANRIRAPLLFALLLLLTAYSLATGDVREGLSFAFFPRNQGISAEVVLASIGQAFYATGVGQAVMLAYGAYATSTTSLLRSALIISGSIILVSVLATLLIFPLVYRYGLNPAQGPELVFSVLPAAFARMPAGRTIGTMFFLLLILASLTPALAGIEPSVAWLQTRFRLCRARAVGIVTLGLWAIGLPSELSFSYAAKWHPLAGMSVVGGMTVFELVDFISSNVLLPVSALLICAFLAWRLPRHAINRELPESSYAVRKALRFLLRYVCPIAIVSILAASVLFLAHSHQNEAPR